MNRKQKTGAAYMGWEVVFDTCRRKLALGLVNREGYLVEDGGETGCPLNDLRRVSLRNVAGEEGEGEEGWHLVGLDSVLNGRSQTYDTGGGAEMNTYETQANGLEGEATERAQSLHVRVAWRFDLLSELAGWRGALDFVLL